MAGQFQVTNASKASIDKIRRRLQLLSSTLAQALFKGSYPSEAALIAERGNPSEGWSYYNTSIGQTLTFHKNAWYQLTIDGENGSTVDFKGSFTVAPLNPVTDDAYYDTVDGVVYIYNGVAWEIMSQAGGDIFITYNDSDLDATPANPTGDGTTGGWHTDATEDVNWLSQKVAVGGSSTTEVLTVPTMSVSPSAADTLTQAVSGATMLVASSTATTITGTVTGIWDTTNTFTSDGAMTPTPNTVTSISSWGTPIPAKNLIGAVGPEGPQGEDGLDGSIVPILSGVDFKSEDPTGTAVSWSQGTINFGTTEIAMTAGGNTTLKYIYWVGPSATTLSATNTLATATATGNWLVCINQSGTAYPAQATRLINAGMMVVNTLAAISVNAGTLTAGDITALTISADKMTVGTLIAARVVTASLSGFATAVPTTWTKRLSQSFSNTTVSVAAANVYEDWEVSSAAARENALQEAKWSVSNLRRDDGFQETFRVTPALWKRAGGAGGTRTLVFSGDEIFITNSVETTNITWEEEKLADHGIGSSDYFEVGFRIKITSVTSVDVTGKIVAQSQDWSDQSIAK
jgi:hypothetical protein